MEVRNLSWKNIFYIFYINSYKWYINITTWNINLIKKTLLIQNKTFEFACLWYFSQKKKKETLQFNTNNQRKIKEVKNLK